MKKLLFAVFLISCFIACKKDDDSNSDTPVYVDFTAYKYSGTTLPALVSFKANIPDGADQVTWNFGDSTTATGDSVTHIFNRYDTFSVTVTATKGSLSGSKTKVIPITIYKKLSISSVEVLESPQFNGNSQTWDPGNDKPDIACKLTFPGSVVYTSASVIENSDTGTIAIPFKNTDILYGDVKVELVERDTTPSLTYATMGFSSFNIASYLKGGVALPDSIMLSESRLRMKVKITWIP